ncbi:MAG: HEAT repeat domain-containing protein [Deltaproteobacteria bacterium]
MILSVLLCLAPSLCWSQDVNSLISDLKARNSNVRFQAKNSLAKIGKPAVGPLIEALKTGEPEFREDVAHALGLLKDKDAVEPLIEALRKPGLRARGLAAWALGEIGDERAIQPIVTAAVNETDRHLREDVYRRALAQFPPASVSKAMFPATQNVDADIRQRAFWFMGELGLPASPSETGSTLAALKDPSSETRAKAAFYLGSLKKPENIPPLSALLSDQAPAVRRSAVEALGNIGNPSAIPYLKTALIDIDDDTRIAAGSALSGMGLPGLQALIEAMDAPEPVARLIAGHQLWGLTVSSKTPEISSKAAKALSRAVKENNFPAIAGGYDYFMRWPIPEETLITALEQYGYRDMAQDFINEGTGRMKEAARTWAGRNGYTVEWLCIEGDCFWSIRQR